MTDCEYCCASFKSRKTYREEDREAWVNVECKTLDISLWGNEHYISITRCPWCGREL